MAYITLNKKSLFHNLEIIAQKACSIDKVALVLKDNAYGHGLREVAAMAQEFGVTKAVVKNEAEAIAIEEFFEDIIILTELPSSRNNFIYTINEISDITNIIEGSRVVLKVDSGMHRNGISVEELEEAFKKMAEKKLNLHSVMSHHRAADTLSSEWFWQKKNFEGIKERSNILAKKYGFEGLLFHSQNSAALFRSETSDDIVRVGIAAYGCLEMQRTLPTPELKPVLSVYAQKLSSRVLNRGEGVGYNAIEKAQKEMLVSNYDFGYADGFFRSLSSKYLTPEGKRVFGRISMDNATFAECDEEELLIFSDAREVARQAKTIPYEILVTLPSTMKRVVV